MELPTEHKKQILSWMKDMKQIRKDLTQAQAAGVPNVELLLQRCDNCDEYLQQLKQQYIDKK